MEIPTEQKKQAFLKPFHWKGRKEVSHKNRMGEVEAQGEGGDREV